MGTGFPVAILLPIAIYGFFVTVAFGLALFLSWKEFRENDAEMVLLRDVFILAIFGGVVGARILCVFEFWPAYRSDLVHAVFSFFGFSVIGGFILGTILCWIRIRHAGQSILRIGDLMSPGLAVGYAVGRLGCLFSGDGCYGAPTISWFGMTFPNGLCSTLSERNPLLCNLFRSMYPGEPVPAAISVHPAPLYESLSHIALFILLLALPLKVGSGRRYAIFLVWFGVSRFLVEFIRLNPIVHWGLTTHQVLSLFFVGSGIIAFFMGPKSPCASSG